MTDHSELVERLRQQAYSMELPLEPAMLLLKAADALSRQPADNPTPNASLTRGEAVALKR
jgi:hypothetical protein